MYEINIMPVIISAIIAFVISAFWYSPMLFGKTWMRLSNIDEESIAEDRARGIWKKYIIHFIATVITFFVLSFIISLTGPMSAFDGAFLGFILWIGFVATASGAPDLLWRKTPLKVVLIDYSNILLSLIVGGAIIAVW